MLLNNISKVNQKKTTKNLNDEVDFRCVYDFIENEISIADAFHLDLQI